MRDSREESLVVTREVYDAAYRYYTKCMAVKVVVIILIAIVGLVGIIENAINHSGIGRLLCVVSYTLLFGQVLTLPDGTVVDFNGNRFDLYSGKFLPK